MKSKLGCYFISLGGIDTLDYVSRAKPSVIVSMEHNVETWRAVKKASPNTFIVGRYYVDDSEQIFEDNPEARAEEFFHRMEPDANRMRGIYDAWMGLNESVVQSPEQAQALSRFYVRWGDLMRQANLKSCAYSFATGNPEVDLWKHLLDGLRHCDYLSLHEYSAPTMDVWQTWLCLRYRRVMDALPADAERPIIITETGIDGGAGPANRPQDGWSKFTDAAGYLSTLMWYDKELQKDDYVIGATIFAMNGWGNNGSFGMAELSNIRDYMGQGGDPAPIGKPATQPVTQPVTQPTTQPVTQPTTPPVTPPTGDTLTYTIQSGDTLSKIAKQFGVSVTAIVQANNIENPSLIRPGQVLKIPAPSSTTPTYTVKPGDTLESIAKLFGVMADAILKANNITDLVKPGQNLTIPPSSTTPPTTSKPVTPSPAPIPNLAQLVKGPPFPRFALHDPCAQDPGNLITNGSMGPGHHDTEFGTVCDGWTPFIMKGNPPNFRWVDNEMIDPFGSQQLFSSDEFDAGVYQTVTNLKPGTYYMIRWGYSLAAKSFDGPNVRVETIGRKLGVDPYGGTDPKSPNVVWGPDFFNGVAALNIPAMQMIFPACSDKATIFLRAMATDGSGGENRVWIDAICMEARTEIPPIDIPKPATPAPQPAQPAPAPAPSGDATTYTIQPGDTLSAIAKKFGTTVNALVAANNIANPSLIKPGQVLTIPK